MSMPHPLESSSDSLVESIKSQCPSSASVSIKNRYSFEFKPQQESDQVIHHLIQPDDTLEGICVMYRANVGEVKRLNRLWTNDSVHLRKILQIPIQKSHTFQGRPLSMPTKPPNAFYSLRASSSNESLNRPKDNDPKQNTPKSVKKEHILSTRELIDLIDRDVSLIIQELGNMNWSIPPSPSSLDKRSQYPLMNFKDLRSKTTRVTITPLDPKASCAFASSDLVPIQVVFTLTPLLRTYPESVQTSVKASVLSKLKKTLSSSFLNRLATDDKELYDMVVISDKSKQWNNL